MKVATNVLGLWVSFSSSYKLQVLLRIERATALITQKIEKKIKKTLKDKKHRQNRETDKIYRLSQTRMVEAKSKSLTKHAL